MNTKDKYDMFYLNRDIITVSILLYSFTQFSHSDVSDVLIIEGPLGWPLNRLKVKLQRYSQCLLYLQWYVKVLQRDQAVGARKVFEITRTKGSCFIQISKKIDVCSVVTSRSVLFIEMIPFRLLPLSPWPHLRRTSNQFVCDPLG